MEPSDRWAEESAVRREAGQRLTHDRCGLETIIIEKRMNAQTPAVEEDIHVALVGVDNVATRHPAPH